MRRAACSAARLRRISAAVSCHSASRAAAASPRVSGVRAKACSPRSARLPGSASSHTVSRDSASAEAWASTVPGPSSARDVSGSAALAAIAVSAATDARQVISAKTSATASALQIALGPGTPPCTVSEHAPLAGRGRPAVCPGPGWWCPRPAPRRGVSLAAALNRSSARSPGARRRRLRRGGAPARPAGSG